MYKLKLKITLAASLKYIVFGSFPFMPPHTLCTPPPDTEHMSLRSKTSSKNMARGHWDASNIVTQ